MPDISLLHELSDILKINVTELLDGKRSEKKKIDSDDILNTLKYTEIKTMEKHKNNINLISSMGTGNKLDPTLFRVSDVYKTKVCPLAKVMRHELRKRGVKKLKVVYSEEIPMTPDKGAKVESKKRQTPGSISFVPSTAGLIIASEVVKDIIKEE